LTDWSFGGSWPYEPRFFDTADGRMHYVDEGERHWPAVVLLHGNPTWAYLYRFCIRELLAHELRAIAIDHLGFGRSDIPERSELYSVARHSHRLAHLLEQLQLNGAVLVVHDWAGPIALPWAADAAGSLAGLVLLNTFAPRLPGPIGSRDSLRALRAPLLGPFLVKQRNVPVEQFLFGAGTVRASWDDREQGAYRAPHPTPASRVPILAFPRQLPFDENHPVAVRSRSTAEQLEERFSVKPVRILWGMKDVLFGSEVLAQWEALLPRAEVTRLEDAGHFLQEDEPEPVANHLAQFALRATRGGQN
jgi:cis-3-alkyl-4-acyloxetan-2-one decarboxylase